MNGVVWLIVGIVLLAIGAGLLLWGRRTQAKTDLLRSVATSNAADVPSLMPGELTEVKGTIRCDTPLTGPESQKPCVWYSTAVLREYEDRTKNTNNEWQITRGSESLSSNQESTPFFVEDTTGRVRIDPSGAEVDAPTTVDRFEDATNEAQQVSVDLTGIYIGGNGGRRTLGYRHQEQALEVGTPVYVLGAVRESGEIGAPPRGSQGRFIVSHRSEEALTESWGSSARHLGYAAVACLALGALGLVAGLVLLVV